MKKQLLFVLMLILSSVYAQAQLTGTKNVPGDYPDIQSAISDLNSQGVGAGGVTISIGASQTLSATLQIGSAALSVGANASTSANPVVIDGNGFAINANFAGTRAGSQTSGSNDAIIALNGPDYVTIKNFTFNEQVTNTTTTSALENAIGCYNRLSASPFDGCQYIYIENNTFNMTEAGTSGAIIQISPSIYTSTTLLTHSSFATDPTQMNRYIYVTNNNFASGYNYVAFNGSSGANGRALVVTGNTMTNIGGAAITSYGLYAQRLDSLIFNNNTCSGAASQSSTNYIAFASTNCGGRQEANNNSMLLQANVTTSTTNGINYTSVGVARQINGNTVTFGAFPSITSGSIQALYGTYSGGNAGFNLEVSNNTITNQNLPVTTGTCYLIYQTSAVSASNDRNIVIDNNNFSNITKGNSGTFYAIYALTSDTVKVRNNNISNFTITNNSASGSSTFYGIYNSSTSKGSIITGNTVKNISMTGTSTSTASSVRGIFCSVTGTGGVMTMANNNINNLQFPIGSTTTGQVIALNPSTSQQSDVYNNRVYNLATNQSSGSVTGLLLSGGTSVNIYNNMLSDLRSPNANSATAVTGINLNAGTTANVIHNTIYAGSAGPLTSIGVLFGGAGIQVTNTVNASIQNNIIHINGTAAGDAYFAAVRRATVGVNGTNPTSVTMSNNIYSAPYIFGEGTTLSTATNDYYIAGGSTGIADPAFNTPCGLFKAWKGDNGSFSEDNLAGAAGEYTPGGASYAESGASTTTTPLIANDYYNVARGATPDIGAAEFSGAATDAAGPAISYTNIPTQNCDFQPVVSAIITDASTVNSNPGTAPRLYYKLSTEANTLLGNTAGDNGWKYVETTDPNSPYSFTIDYTLLTTAVSPGSILEYFVVAEDQAATINVGANSVIYNAGYCPTTVALTAGAFPVSGVKTYSINPVPVSTISASPTTVCTNNNVTLSSLFSNPGTATVGTGTLTSTTTTPFYGSATLARRVQYLYTAAELTAQGLVAGDISAISFNATTAGSLSIPGFTVKMGHTAATALTTSWSADATTTVRPSGMYSAVTGPNAINFTTPFSWNGSSNIVIEICHDVVGLTPIMSVNYHVGPTASAAYVANASGCATATATAVTTTRPTITFTGFKGIPGLTYNWDDGSSSVGTTNPLTIPVPFSGGPTQVYNITATDATGCTFTNSVTVTQNNTAPVIGTTSLAPLTACSIDSITVNVPVSGGCPPYTYVYTLTPTGYGTPYTLTVTNNKFQPLYAGTVDVTVTDNTNQTASATVGTFTMQDPPTVTGDTRCGPGTVNLTATSASPAINWYATPTGGTTLYTGTAYSPLLASTTTFYVASADGGVSGTLGLPNRIGATTNSGYSDIGLMFDATNAFTINSVAIYPVATTPSGNVTATIQLKNSAGTVLQSTTVSVPTSVSPGIKTTIPLNFVVPAAGTGYRLVFASASGGGITGFIRETSGYTYPYTLSGVGSITSAYTSGPSASFYYYFYDWQVSTACESSRVPVTGTITAPPTLSATASQTICNNEVYPISAIANPGDFDQFAWSPTTGLYEDAAATIPYTGGNFQTVYVKNNVGGITTYSVGAFNTTTQCQNYSTTTVTVMPAATISAVPATICVSGTADLSLSPLTGYGAGSIQWQNSTTGVSGSYTNIPSAVNPTYSAPTTSTNNWYGVVFKDGAGTTCQLNPTVFVEVTNPQLLTTTPGTRCGTGSVQLQATASAGSAINWYAASTGGIPLASGTTFNTPAISSTTTYYAAATSGSTIVPTGMPSALSTATSGAGTTNYGLVFDALTSFTLQSVKVYPVSATSAAGTVTVDVIDGNGTVMHTATFPVTGAPVGSIPPTTLNLNFNIAPGTNYKIRPGFTGITGLLFEPAAGAPGGTYPYPYVVPGVLSINYSTLTAAPTNTQRLDLYYYFYDWLVTAGCEGPRQPVTATVTPAPSLTATASATVCNNEVKMLTVTSNLPDYDVYTWAPTTNLFEDAACTIAYSGGNFSTVYVKNPSGGATTYTLTSTNTSNGCGNIATSTITTMPLVTMTAIPSSICQSGTTTISISPTSGYGTGTIQWMQSSSGLSGSYSAISGANTTSYTSGTLTADTWYGIEFSDGANTCVYNPTTQVTVNSPSILSTQGATICGGSGSATLSAVPSSGANAMWYTASTGGTPIFTGNNFTTPVLTSSTDYWVSAGNGSAGGFVGATDPSIGSSATTTLTNHFMQFTVNSPITLSSVNVHWTAAVGSAYNIVLQQNNSPTFTQIANYSGTTTVTGLATPETIPVNFVLTPGNYRLGFITNPGCHRNTTGASYPYSIPGVIDITGNTFSTAYWYFFYQWNITAGCESARQPVSAIVTTNPCTATVTANFMIQGYYDVNTSAMQPVLLNSNGVGSSTESDNVTVELHDATPPYALAHTFSGVQGINGQIVCTFPPAAVGNSYYIVLKGRNAIETWSAAPVLMATSTSYDFTTAAAQAYSGNQIDVNGFGLYAIYNGDVNQDGVVDGLDFNDWETDNNNFASGYITSDFNGDGIVDGLDFLIWEPNNNNFVGIITP